MSPQQLAQEVENAFDNRDRDALHRNLARLVAIADAVGLQRLSVIELERLRDQKPAHGGLADAQLGAKLLAADATHSQSP